MTGLVIDGRVVDGRASRYPVCNPVRPAEVVHEAPEASPGQLDEAVAAARRAAPGWAALPVSERAAAVTAAGDAAAAAVAEDDLATLLTREHGKVLWEAEFDVSTPGAIAGAFGDLAAEALAPRRTGEGPGSSAVTHEPYGVVAAVLPFNWPVSVMAVKAVPALLAGNTVVVKAPPTCPGAVLAVVAAMAAALPPGVLQAVNGPGPELGEALVTHPGVDMVSFTGGVATGRRVMAAVAGRLRPAVLELGGNDAAILAPDVHVDSALARRLIEAAFLTSGQVCMAAKRLYAPAGRVREVVDALVEQVAEVVVGDGLTPEVTMGPVHTATGRVRAEALLGEAEAGGATVHRPAEVRPDDADAGGYLVPPAVVDGASPTCWLVREEQFAPLLPVLPYRDLDDAVEQANDTAFGLCASVWSHDGDLADGLARRLEVGTVFVNHHGTAATDHRAPFGGWKESGLGRELGPEGILAYTRPRSVTRHELP